ncbi:MAG TPA: YidC/Oxa1 family membrane protein insertase [Candidatus Baltobacteraceae bacterium]
MHVLLATSWLDPIVYAVNTVVMAINSVVHNPGWSLVIFALGLKLLFWPLNSKQFMAMIKMQQLAPQLKKMQEKYGKSDPQRYQKETMELYKKNGANPLAGCWPMLVQYPFIISVYYAVLQNKPFYGKFGWLWIGTPFAQHFPTLLKGKLPILGTSLAGFDLILLVLYMISMYLFSRYATMPSTDPQQAQTQKLMAWFSPIMLGYFGFQWKWPSAMILYWFSYNVFTMGQQFFLLSRAHQPLSVLDNEHAITDIPADAKPQKAIAGNGAVKPASGTTKTAKKKKGAKR